MNHTLNAMAWTLIHFCWQAAAVAAVYRVLMVALSRSASEIRYVVSLAALGLMAAGALGTFGWEMRSAHPSPALHEAAAEIRHVALGAVAPQVRSEMRETVGAERGEGSANLLRWIDGAWVLGVLVLSMRSIGGWWVIQRLRATATDEAPAALQASFVRISAALGLQRPALLRVSSAIAGPITIGAVRAMVLLPLSALTLLGAEELEMVLAHELAHVRRADFLCNLLQTLLETLFFFHPAVWWMGKRIRHERELCCDDLALQICPNPVTYATALFRLEEQRVRQWRLAMALDGHQSNQTLRMRIARILGEPAAQGGGRSIQPFSLIVAGIALAVSLLATPPVVASFTPAHVRTAQHAVMQAIAKPRAGVAAVHAAASPTGAQQAAVQADAAGPQPKPAAEPEGKSTYIDRMKAAGYDVDLDKYIAMKIQDVTPEFAQQMAKAGLGKLSADDLIACKIQGVTPEFALQMNQAGLGKLSAEDLVASRIHGVSPDEIVKLKQEGFEIKQVQDAISLKIFNVTPEFVSGMKGAGFSNLTQQQLLSLRVQGVTPEYARGIAQQFPGATVDDVIKSKIFQIDGAFIEQAKKFGMKQLTLDKLVQLRNSGILDDESMK